MLTRHINTVRLFIEMNSIVSMVIIYMLTCALPSSVLYYMYVCMVLLGVIETHVGFFISNLLLFLLGHNLQDNNNY